MERTPLLERGGLAGAATSQQNQSFPPSDSEAEVGDKRAAVAKAIGNPVALNDTVVHHSACAVKAGRANPGMKPLARGLTFRPHPDKQGRNLCCTYCTHHLPRKDFRG